MDENYPRVACNTDKDPDTYALLFYNIVSQYCKWPVWTEAFQGRRYSVPLMRGTGGPALIWATIDEIRSWSALLQLYYRPVHYVMKNGKGVSNILESEKISTGPIEVENTRLYSPTESRLRLGRSPGESPYWVLAYIILTKSSFHCKSRVLFSPKHRNVISGRCLLCLVF